MTTTLAEFLRDRIAEDEAGEGLGLPSDFGPCYDCGGMDRARIEAECAAKRQIVELHSGSHWCEMCGDGQYEQPCPTLRTLAAIYASDPAYRKEWTQ